MEMRGERERERVGERVLKMRGEREKERERHTLCILVCFICKEKQSKEVHISIGTTCQHVQN